jgi:hypothetical protein
MRNPVTASIVALLAVLALSSAVMAQEPRGRAIPPGYIAEGVPAMPNPPGPAPKHDLTGAWVGPQKTAMGPYSDMTPAGEAAFKLNHPVPPAGRVVPDAMIHLAASNDPFMICDPLGFPRDLLNHAVSMRGGIEFEPTQNRMLILFEQQRIWREVWMDGRELPKKVDVAGAPDSRYYGYSVGHWDGDNTFVIDTTGLDERTWIDEVGHPHTIDAKLEERWTRVDQYHLEATVTVNDPKYYTKPFQLMKTSYYWMKNQNVEEELCLPSQALEYRDKLAAPSGWGEGGK